ncbi:josephin-like protein [Gastrolobium bilobum]|uniref:josephin-like protein n=1 Tax=Gastrolobium bilobum TaxID=150636 RepID=UPI002AB06661|nr:josephin-like protein [Gastrolobium bilobum]
MSHKRYFFEKTSLHGKQNSKRRAYRNQHAKSCMFRIPWRSEFSPIEFLKGVAERVTKAFCLCSVRRSTNRGSSSMGRSKPIGVSVDYYRTAAVEDCIDFIHTSFSRSNSLTTTIDREEVMHTFLKNFQS